MKSNVLLKAILKEVYDLYLVGKKAVAKDFTGLFAALLGAGEDAPAIIQNLDDLMPELKNLLADPASDAELLAYAAGLVGGESKKAAAIISASADLVLSSVSKIQALVAAIEMPSDAALAASASAPAEPAKS